MSRAAIVRRSAVALVSVSAALLTICFDAPPSGAAPAPSVALQGMRPLGVPANAVTALQLEYRIAGSGYGATPQRPEGGVPPLSAIVLTMPEGTAITPRALGQCSELTLENFGPQGCDSQRTQGTTGAVLAEVNFGAERVPENAFAWSFPTASGESFLYLGGSSPVSFEFVTRVTPNFVDSGPSVHSLTVTMPAVATVPGAPLASFKAISFPLLASIDPDSEGPTYLEFPAACPPGGYPLSSQLVFGGSYGGEREFGIPAETVTTAAARLPCRGNEAAAPPQEALPGTGGAIVAPSAKTCVSRRDFRIHVLQIHGLVYRRVTVAVNGVPVSVVRGRRTSARVDLRGLPKGRYAVQITVVTTDDKRISGTRAYHTCARKKLLGGNPRL